MIWLTLSHCKPLLEECSLSPWFLLNDFSELQLYIPLAFLSPYNIVAM